MREKETGQQQQKHEILLGKYEMGRLLGRGNFAKVYHARCLSDNSSVAIKVLDKPSLSSTGAAPLVLREVSAMRRLSDHPNILKLHEIMATRSKIYLVMDYAHGGELFSRLTRRGRLPEIAARRYFEQLISALRFCHAHGISHRDLKPENLLLDRHGNLKLSDFGLSALPDSFHADGLLHTTCGTPAYMAPEIISRRGGYDGAKADAWSCGVILFMLLAGFLPFDASNIFAMCRRMFRREYQFPSWFSPSVKQVVFKLLDPNPATRISIEGLMELPWIRRAYSLDERLNLLSYLPPLQQQQNGVVNDDDKEITAAASSISAPTMNAFDIIISLSSGLDLSGFFDDGKKREERFTSKASIDKILERIEEVGPKFGYSMEKKKEGSAGVVGRGRWGAVLSVDVLEIASPILLVELKVDGGNGAGICWGSLREELGDIVFAWHKNGEESY